jgi:RimJ/RimL family protein N-acetyltransferase
VNHLGQPIGPPLDDWTPPPRPARETMSGRYCRIEPLDAHHAPELWDANARDTDHRNWTYLPYGPFSTLSAFETWVRGVSASADPLFYAIVTTAALGVASYLRVAPEAGSIEVGHINYSPLLQRTRAATEAMYLMMKRAFDLGYRRYEWKCDALNKPSRAAAERLGFTYEGTFRQATVYKGRNRDSAWYSVIDSEWPNRRARFERWLAPENFDGEGKQRTKLGD